MNSLSSDLSKQRIALLLEEAESDRLANWARAARRRHRHRVRQTLWGRTTGALAGTIIARVVGNEPNP